ncbi:MAG: UDP-N-acetylglucosamine 1-carboxyvinyltransferase [Ruminococcaceae bacterium]|nr:UDP-N-acetylglucosamine 1-carboxyvinyltransferase [Oscillospiraceae bacterium]
MDVMRIRGGKRLEGEIPIHGAKNSALPLLAATLLVPGVSEIHNCPRLSDVDASLTILRHLGCRVTRCEDVVTVDATAPCRSEIPDDLMRQMRSSIVFLGAVVARCGQAVLTHPGGCELGPRPIDLHLAALSRLGVQVEECHGTIRCTAPQGVQGNEISLSFPSVGATENVLLAACTAVGTTRLHNAAREPEIGDLCRFLNGCGARISGMESGTITIEGVRCLHPVTHRVMPDRIEAATYLAAAALTGGDVTLTRCAIQATAPVFPALEQAGCRLCRLGEDTLRVRGPQRPERLGTVRTLPYPGFPTDGAAPLVAVACGAKGTSVFVETIFENRYRYVDELTRMGARIRVDGRVAVVEGVPRLQGAQVACTDLRGGAALAVAALAATGETCLTNLTHLDRGYEDFEGCLRAVGAEIVRETVGKG